MEFDRCFVEDQYSGIDQGAGREILQLICWIAIIQKGLRFAILAAGPHHFICWKVVIPCLRVMRMNRAVAEK